MNLRKMLGDVFASGFSKNQHRIYISKQAAERLERRMEEAQQAQDRLARAMAEYAEQLKSHSSAIESLSKASHEFTKRAAEHNEVLTRLIRLMEQPPAGAEQITPESEKKTKIENIEFPLGCYRRRRL